MALDAFFPEDAASILASVVIARGELTTDETEVLQAVAAAFKTTWADVLAIVRATVEQPPGRAPAPADGDGP